MSELEKACQRHWRQLDITSKETLKTHISEIFDHAESQENALISLYRLVLPDWDRIERVHGHPEVGTDLWQFVCREFMEFDKKNHPTVMPGGAWINTGFSSNKELSPWEISFENCSVDLLPEEEGASK